jgi:glycosyltransferase involved in cell wall biosynthesis
MTEEQMSGDHGGKNIELVSVVIPTYNRPELLKRALSSAINQTYPKLEVIVVDDASSEDVEPIIARFDDPRIKFMRHQKNRGATAARNTGIEHSQGRYLSFLDDDDEWSPDKIAAQMEDLASKGGRYKISYCLREIFYDEQGKVTRFHTQGWDGNHLDQLIAGTVRPPTTCFLIAKECLEMAGGFREDLRRMQDHELWIRLAQYYDFAFLNSFLVRVHVEHGPRLSDDYQARLNAYSIIYHAHRKMLWRHRRSLSDFLMCYGFELRDHGQRRKAITQFTKAAVASPFRRDPYIALGSTLMTSTRQRNSTQ